MCQRAQDLDLMTLRFKFLNDLDFLSIYRLRKFLLENPVDAIIATKVKEYWLAGWAASLVKIPFIIRLGIFRNIPDTLKNRIIYHKFMDAMIVNSNAIRDNLERNSIVDLNRVSVVYNGIRCPETLDDRISNVNEKIIITVGNLSARKNVSTLLKIFFKLRNDLSSFKLRLWIVGDGIQRRELEDLTVQLGIAEHVRFWGFRDDIPDLLLKSDMMVLLSHAEGFPNGGLEAMAWGVPLVISDFAGVEEFVTDGVSGLIVNPANEKEVVKRINMLVTSKELQEKLRRNAFKKMKDQFSLTVMTDNIESVIRSIVNA
jgi:glycosyltransferase involved in cell wall biosynthesis